MSRTSRRLGDLLSLAKPRVMVLALATALAGLLLAPGSPAPGLAALTLLGVALVVGGANALNMVLEADVDGRMLRTRRRPLPSGRVSPEAALAFGLAESMIGVPLLALAVHPLAGCLGAAALVLYVLVYTPLKRRTPLALLVGAIAGAAPSLIGDVAAAGRPTEAGLALFAFVLLWQVPHTIALSLDLEGDYRRAGLHTLSGRVGARAARRIAFLAVAALVVVSLAFPRSFERPGHAAAALGLGGLLLAQAAAGLRKSGEAGWARALFRGSIVYLAGFISFLLVNSSGNP